MSQHLRISAPGAKPDELPAVAFDRQPLQIAIVRQLLFAVRDPGHQPAKKKASLKTFDKVEQRVGQTIAVEFSQRVEGIHIAKIEQP